MYDEIELMGFLVSGILFYLARSDYGGGVLAKDLAHYPKKILRIVTHMPTWKTVGIFLDS